MEGGDQILSAAAAAGVEEVLAEEQEAEEKAEEASVSPLLFHKEDWFGAAVLFDWSHLSMSHYHNALCVIRTHV